MPDEIINEPTPTPSEPQTAQTEPALISTENPVSEQNPIPESPQEPMPDASIPPIDYVPLEVPPEVSQSSPSPQSAVPVKDQNDANEPLEQVNPTPPATASPEASRAGITVEKHGNDVTITEIMEPTAHSEPATAQMAGNEPIDLAEEEKAKRREENLKLANETRQEKKREKIDEILTLFSENKEITNDEVEKLLHVSDATATRYLETLEKEGKIKQVGRTGKSVSYTKI